VRIIAGQYKGRRLQAPRWPGLRPTSDKLRETLFNVLAPRIEGARVLDAYAGTGAVGLEALSRGAAKVAFIDHDRRSAGLVRTNVTLCGVEEQRYTIHCGEVAGVLRRLDAGVRFDLIFLDPPYDHPPTLDVLDAAGRRLEQHGLLVLEHAARGALDVPADLERVRDVRSGDSTLTFFARRPGQADATEQR
jgi:16S rRNA (guanine(966)-N(2))-methyltransferase RsmD